jgi:heme-degrading monooxygenase HmoA
VIVSIVRFRSPLRDEEVRALFERRAPDYEQVPGLVEKIYLRFAETGEWGAVYLWDSEEALAGFRESQLAAGAEIAARR